MRKLDINKLKVLRTADTFLAEKYGESGQDRQRFDQASLDWYESQCQSKKLPRKSYSVSIPASVYDRVSDNARNMGQSVSAYVRQVLANEMQLA